MLQMVIMKIDQAERHDMVANGEASKIKKRLAWGRIALRSAGYIESPRRSWWKLSEFGVTQARVLGEEILKTATSLTRAHR